MSEMQRQASLSAGDVLYEAARVACLAPSIENSQPWRWRIRGNTLELHADRSSQLTATDPEGRLMIVSCGAVLHHATVVLAALGAAATVERIDDPADPDLLARLTLIGHHQVTAEDMRLHHALRTRCALVARRDLAWRRRPVARGDQEGGVGEVLARLRVVCDRVNRRRVKTLLRTPVADSPSLMDAFH